MHQAARERLRRGPDRRARGLHRPAGGDLRRHRPGPDAEEGARRDRQQRQGRQASRSPATPPSSTGARRSRQEDAGHADRPPHRRRMEAHRCDKLSGGWPTSERIAELERDLAEALERQSAADQVLEVLGRSTFELEPVFETVLQQAVRLCRADAGLIYVLDGDVYRVEVDARRLAGLPRLHHRRAAPGGVGRRSSAASGPSGARSRSATPRRTRRTRWRARSSSAASARCSACRCSPRSGCSA